MTRFSERLEEIVSEHDITRAALAGAANTGVRHMFDVQTGNYPPRIKTVYTIAKALEQLTSNTYHPIRLSPKQEIFEDRNYDLEAVARYTRMESEDPQDIVEYVAAMIFEKRKKLNISQGVLAEKAELSINSVYNYEHAKTNLKTASLEKVAESLKLQVEYLTDSRTSHPEAPCACTGSEKTSAE